MEYAMTQSQIHEDIVFLHKTISENNPFKFLKERTHNVKWDELLQHFLKMAKDIENPTDFIRLVTSICDSTKCGHISIASDWLTSLHNNQFFDDTSPWRVIADDNENYRKNLYWNDIIKSMEHGEGEEQPTPMRHVVHALKLDKDTVYLSIPMMRLPDETIIETYRRTAFLLRSHNHLIIDLRGNCGGGDSAWSVFLEMVMSNDFVTPLYCFYRSGGDVEQFCDFLNDDDTHIVQRKHFILNGLNEKIDEILFTDEFAPPIIINEIIRKNKESVEFSGKIVVIIDSCNFSSAEAFLVRIKFNRWATLIGETSGGDGVGSTPAIFVLPNSGLCIRYPVILGLNPDGTINDEYPVAPDIFCTVAPFEKPLSSYEDNGLEWLMSDQAVQTAMRIFSGTT